MRGRRAAAAVLLVWALLFLLALAPGSPSLTESSAGPAPVAVVAGAEAAGEAGPGEGNPAHRPAAVRAPRATGPKGADDRGTARADARVAAGVQRDGTRAGRPCPVRAGPAAGDVRSVRELQTFRC
ncbi:hypothetical protein [Streptomyces parvulus]|uniref:hypothetical protein n=1 Tax=Streptomyces parvulus TaxID=146923 RepID=UPI003695FFDC